MKAIFFVCLCLLLLSRTSLAQDESFIPNAQTAPQYRGFWVDTFNTALNNHNDVIAVINSTKQANCNALFVQVRRRGDSWYRNSLEPLADRTPIQAGFDPLADLIREAHANNLEVHAFVIIGALWNGNPTATPARPPEDPNHAFNQHGFNATTGKLYEGRANWLTRTLLPDDSTITFQGQRFGNDFWLDLGHPDAAAYTFEVLMHLVRNYDLDGLHLDRIRYPETTATQSGGASIGYNETNVARFAARYGLPAGSLPAATDARWQQWRRDQVTNFVRRVYLNAIAAKPQIKISAATIVFGGGPTTEAAWASAEAYWRVFQDWRAWMEEGILDLNVPMNYKREHTASNVPLFDTWAEYIKNHSYERVTAHGLGVYLNSLEGTLRQIRKAVAPSAQGNRSSGVVFFSHANTNDLVAANPWSLPANQNTPRRAFSEFAAALTTGKSADGATLYEDVAANPTPVLAQAATVPVMPWKANPLTGYLMGLVTSDGGTPNTSPDTASVNIQRLADGKLVPSQGRVNVPTATDGNGFYGALNLAPGTYLVSVTPVGGRVYEAPTSVTVVAGQVAQLNFTLGTEQLRPLASVSAASYSTTAVAAESIVAAFGEQLSDRVLTANQLPLPTELGGVSVSVRDSAGNISNAPLFFVSPTQINYLFPADLNVAAPALGLARVTVIRNGSPLVARGLINIDRVAPGIFAANANGQGVPAAIVLRVKADGALVTEPVARFDAAQNKFVPSAIDLGLESDQVFLVLFGTGLRGRSALAQVQVRLGGQTAEVLFAGAQGDFAGLDQINVRLPRSLAGRGDLDVMLSVDNSPSNTVQLRIK